MPFAVDVVDPVGCGRFVARVLRGVDPSAESPAWLQQRLAHLGMRSISALVDISNYVMLELGQPNHPYDLAKVAVNRLAYSQGHELAPHRATAVAVTPGWMRSEIMLEHYGVREDNWRDALASAGPAFAESETTRFVGRGIAALAADPDRSRWNQQSVTAADLARAYGCTDIDGTQPDCWK